MFILLYWTDDSSLILDAVIITMGRQAVELAMELNHVKNNINSIKQPSTDTRNPFSLLA